MRRERTLVRFALLCACLLALSGAARAQDLLPKFEEYAQAAARADRFSGAILVARDGKVLVSKGYGMADVEHDVPNTPETKFRLGSLTKQFTAAAILLLQERGKLSVQDPVCKYVAPCPEAWQPVTIHHLLSHTAGVPNFTNLKSFPDYMRTKREPTTVEALLGRFRDRPLDFKPGEGWNYSNSGYVLLGHVVEKVSGKSYEGFLRENIFEPLKMTSTGYDHADEVVKRRARGYAPGPDGGVVNASYIDMSIPFAAGGLYSTVGDLYLWDQALYGEKLLKKSSLDAMFTAVRNDYGYGYGVNKLFDRRHAAHGGGIEGFATSIHRFLGPHHARSGRHRLWREVRAAGRARRRQSRSEDLRRLRRRVRDGARLRLHRHARGRPPDDAGHGAGQGRTLPDLRDQLLPQGRPRRHHLRQRRRGPRHAPRP
jgi:CubicO group peptidase (beta-lactamase class C family)